MKENIEIIDHTADIGIRVMGSSLEELFLYAAQGMFQILAQPKKNLIPAISFPVDIEADNLEQLLVRWLQELHLAYDIRHLVLSYFWIDEISHNKLSGGGKGMKFDSTRHNLGTDIKAVTYHKLKVEKKDDLWIAEIIFDI